MSIDLFPLYHIDNLDINDTVIEKCKKEYEKNGKEAAYKLMDSFLYNTVPSQTLRSLYLYRNAMFLTKKASILGDGYIEKELVVKEGEKAYNIVNAPLWKRKKWAFLDKDAVLSIKDKDSNARISYSQLSLDDYNNPKYIDMYDKDKTSLSLIKRGGASLIRRTRFDFEYKYSAIPDYKKLYLRYIYNTFKRIFFITCKHGLLNSLSKDDIENIYLTISQFPDTFKLFIIKKVRDYILDERVSRDELKADPTIPDYIVDRYNPSYYIDGEETEASEETYGSSRDIRFIGDVVFNEMVLRNYDLDEEDINYETSSFVEFLSYMHDYLLLPVEYTFYIICAMVNPRFEAIIVDSMGNIGSYLLSGNKKILPTEKSYIGPSKTGNIQNLVSEVINDIPILYEDGITLYENRFISQDDEYNISCYSFNKNKWIKDIPLVDKEKIPYLNLNKPRSLVSIIPARDFSDAPIVWFVYSDSIITYSFATEKWIKRKDDDPYHIDFYNISSLFPTNRSCISALYDEEAGLLIFIDSDGNIASYDIENEASSSYNSEATSNFKPTIHLDVNNNGQVIKAKKALPIEGQDNYTLLLFNDKICQIVSFGDDGILKKNFQFDFAEADAKIIDVIRLREEKKFYIIYSDYKIMELTTYLYIPFVFQASAKTAMEIKAAGKSFCNISENPLYITGDNKLNIIHQIYNIKNRVSGIKGDLSEYVGDGGYIKKYSEHFINPSSITLFSNTYYAINNYIDKVQRSLAKRI